MPAIVCHGLTKRYGKVTALDGLDLTVEGNAIFGFLGPNGAGKTTCLRILTGLSRPTSGDLPPLPVPLVKLVPTTSWLQVPVADNEVSCAA